MNNHDDKMDGNPPGTTHFGFRDVPVGEKQKLVEIGRASCRERVFVGV